MQILVMRQAEMPDILGAVARLGQGTQHHRLDQVRIRAILYFVQQLGVVGRLRLVAAAQRQKSSKRPLLSRAGCDGTGR